MPVQSCTMNSKPGYQYGDSGRCYTYTRGNESSRKRARRKAHLQGAAIEANRNGKSHSKEIQDGNYSDVSEFDDSLNDYIDLIRREFDLQFPYVYTGIGNGDSSYYYVTDVFEDYIVVKSGNKYYEVGFSETEDDITFDDKDKWTAVKLSYVQEMLTGQFRDIIFISEFKGTYPEIKIFDDIDIQELTRDDSDPVYATLPIGKANVISGNGRFYDEKFIIEQEKQVREKKPIGLMGHLSKEERATAFPAEAVHWVGVQRVNELLWGKGYFPPGEPKSRLQRYKATKKKIATSIDASADGVWDASLGAYRMLADTLELNQIDIAPADRAGIGDLAAVPLLTTEMIEKNNSAYVVLPVKDRDSTEDSMGKEDTIKELKASDASLLPDEVVKAIVGQSVSEMVKALGLPEGSSMMDVVKMVQKQKSDAEEAKISARVAELAGDPEKGIKVESIREMVQELVISKNPKTIQEAETAYQEVSSSKRIEELLKIALQETMGPPHRIPTASSVSGKKSKFFVYPETQKG